MSADTLRRYTLDGVAIDSVPPEFALCPYGAYTTFVAVAGSVLAWQRHTERLQKSVFELWGHSLDTAAVAAAVRSHLQGQLTGEATAQSVRVTVYPAELDIARPSQAWGERVLVSSSRLSFPFTPVTTFSVQTTRYARDFAHVKSTGIVPQVKMRREAQLAGYDDVLFLVDDEVFEGATWSVLAWTDGRVLTPDVGVLASITVSQLDEVASNLGWVLERRRVLRSDLSDARLVLAVNVNSPARAISRIDDEDLSVDDDLLVAVADAYSDLARDTV